MYACVYSVKPLIWCCVFVVVVFSWFTQLHSFEVAPFCGEGIIATGAYIPKHEDHRYWHWVPTYVELCFWILEDISRQQLFLQMAVGTESARRKG